MTVKKSELVLGIILLILIMSIIFIGLSDFLGGLIHL